MNRLLPVLAFMLAASTVPADDADTEIVIDNTPEAGVPTEADVQDDARPGKEGSPLVSRPLREMTKGKIKTVRIRYFDKEIWKTEEEAREYVRGFLAHESLGATDRQMWSQAVGVPSIECLVEFSLEHRRELAEARQRSREGRLLLWRTESCYRDATGRWWFVNAFDHYHAAHPNGNHALGKGKP